jgi:hypothetical protein
MPCFIKLCRAAALPVLFVLAACPEESDDGVAAGNKGEFQRIMLWPRDGEVYQSETFELRAQSVDGYQYDLEDSLTFVSKNPDIVQVTPEGKALGVSPGFATIEVTSKKFGASTTTQFACVPPRGNFVSDIRLTGTKVEQGKALPLEVNVGGNAASLSRPVLDDAPLGISLEGLDQQLRNDGAGLNKKLGRLQTSLTTAVGPHKIRVAMLDEGQRRLGKEVEFNIEVTEARPITGAWRKVAFSWGNETGTAIGLTTDGRLIDWGVVSELALPTTLTTPAIDVAIGSNGAAAVLEDGSITSWGGPTGYPGDTPTPSLVVPAGNRYQAVALGRAYGLALTDNGRVVFLKPAEPLSGTRPPESIPDMPTVRAIAAADQFALALDVNGKLHSWGTFRSPGNGMTDVVEIGAFGGMAAARKGDGSVWVYANSGADAFLVPDISDAKAIAVGNTEVLVQRQDGSVAVVDIRNGMTRTTPAPSFAQASKLFAGDSAHLALGADGQLLAIGKPSSAVRLLPRLNASVTNISSGFRTSAFVAPGHPTSIWVTHSDGSISGMGFFNTLASELEPPAGLRDVTQVAVGSRAVVALTKDGRVIGWGAGPQANVPAGLPPAKAIAADARHVVVLLQDTSLVSWPATTELTLPSGRTGLSSIYLDNDLTGVDGEGNLQVVSAALKGEYLDGIKGIGDAAPSVGLALQNGNPIRISRLAIQWPRGHHDIAQLGTFFKREVGDSSSYATPMGALLRPNGKLAVFFTAAPEDDIPNDTRYVPPPEWHPFLRHQDFTAVRGMGAIRGAGPSASALVATGGAVVVVR